MRWRRNRQNCSTDATGSNTTGVAMKRVLDRVVAAVLWRSVASFCSAGVAAESGGRAPLGALLAAGSPARLAPAASGTLATQPRAVVSQVGRVSWKSLGATEPAWSCRTAEGA